MSQDEREPGDSPPPFIRRLTLPNNRNPTTRAFEADFSSDDDDYEKAAPRRGRPTRGYYGSDTSSSSSSSSSSTDDGGPYRSRRSRKGRSKISRKKNVALEASSIYPFSLPGHHRRQSFTEDGSNKGSDVRDGWDDADSEKPESGGESSGIWHRTVKDVQHVYSARYTGEQVLYGGLRSAELKTSQYDGKSSQTPLFQWIHFQDSDMNFEVFQDRVEHIQNLTESQRLGISRLLRKVKNKYDSPLQVANRPTIRIMEPGFLTGVEWPADEQTAMQRNRTSATNVAWICFPYFSLEQYQGLFANPKKGAHPMHTLLQTRSTLVGREREIKQAVCQVSDNQEKLCFHVGQLWCLVIDDSFLVTCGRMSFSTLKGEAVSLNSVPVPGPELSDSPRILVMYGVSVLWIFKTEECPTWFSFYSRFWQFSPRPVEILYQDRVLNEAAWPRILEYAARNERRKQGPLRLSFRLAPRKNKDGLNFMSVGTDQLAQSVPSETVQSLQTNIEESSSIFTVFTQLNSSRTAVKKANPSPGGSSINKSQLSEDLKRMHDFLKHEIEPHERIAYRECPDSSRQEVLSALHAQIQREQRFQTAENEIRTETEKSLVEFKKDLVGACDYIFGFFFPLNLTGPSITKFWGGIHRVISAEIPYSDDEPPSRSRVRRDRFYTNNNEPGANEWELELENLVRCFRSIARKLKPFKDVVTMVSPADRAKIQIPEALPNAWLHLVMALVLYMVPRLGYWESKADIAASLLNDGMAAMLKCFLTFESLLENTVFTPFDLATLLVYQLEKDVTNSRPDIAQTYSQHFSLLDNEVKTKPLDRSHQTRIQLFKEELKAILKTIEKQEDVISSLKACDGNKPESRHINVYEEKGIKIIQNNPYTPGNVVDGALFDEFFKQARPSSSQPGGYRNFLVGDCQSVIGNRRVRADEMHREGNDLAEWNLEQIETNRNRQDSAVYVFTVVTVIFLPLSTVAGILGMNTNDVRNMEVDQWVFWAVALPLTLIITLVCLVATGELRNFLTNLVGLWVQRRMPFSGEGGWTLLEDRDGHRYDNPHFPARPRRPRTKIF